MDKISHTNNRLSLAWRVAACIPFVLIAVWTGRLFAFDGMRSENFAAASAEPQVVESYVFTLSGAAEFPPNASPGSGYGTVIIDVTQQTMQITTTFSALVGTTTAAHIHSATGQPYSGTAGVATTTPSFVGFPLGVHSGTFATTLDMTQPGSYNPAFITANGGTPSSAFAALRAGIADGRAYFNIHTTSYAGGEVRGFLFPALPLRLYLPLVQR